MFRLKAKKFFDVKLHQGFCLAAFISAEILFGAEDEGVGDRGVFGRGDDCFAVLRTIYHFRFPATSKRFRTHLFL